MGSPTTANRFLPIRLLGGCPNRGVIEQIFRVLQTYESMSGATTAPTSAGLAKAVESQEKGNANLKGSLLFGIRSRDPPWVFPSADLARSIRAEPTARPSVTGRPSEKPADKRFDDFSRQAKVVSFIKSWETSRSRSMSSTRTAYPMYQPQLDPGSMKITCASRS